ncbi:TetR/AcrR family transcriptional regulator C-terminal domain-containing protein [Roseixanthobacter glucoisosaccharinicivorans]|uniref:TetR/AcrR family transcriptional regulator C-terminal domain-containing protein n=1 Tax=Roseixanthobacter glucoisosaccharinicivorans TaxID=3119923 RepID=UPI00372D5653
MAAGPGAAIQQIAAYLAALSRDGQLRIPDPDFAAHQFLALVTEDIKLTGTLAFPPPPARPRRRSFDQ